MRALHSILLVPLLLLGCGPLGGPSPRAPSARLKLPPEGQLGGLCFANQSCFDGLDCYLGRCIWAHESRALTGAEGGPCCRGPACAHACGAGLECLAELCARPEGDEVSLFVTDETLEPRYDWNFNFPRRPYYVLVVPEEDPGAILWGVRSESGLDLPIVHGSAPEGAELLGRGYLSRGESYRLVIGSDATYVRRFQR